jgi:hypothetical protein
MENDGDSDRLLALHAAGISADEFMSPAHHPNMNACIAEIADYIGWAESA